MAASERVNADKAAPCVLYLLERKTLVVKHNEFIFLNLGSYRSYKLHSPSSSPEVNAVGTKGDEYQNVLISTAQVHRPTTWVFFYVGIDVEIKYASSNFSLYLYHTE